MTSTQKIHELTKAVPRTNFGIDDQDGTSNVINTGLTTIKGVEMNDIRLTQPTVIDPDLWQKRKRNTVACIGCHSAKQKCVPSDLNNIFLKPCERCLKTSKFCTFDLAKRTRKRRAFQSKFEDSTNNSNFATTLKKQKQISPITTTPVSTSNLGPITHILNDISSCPPLKGNGVLYEPINNANTFPMNTATHSNIRHNNQPLNVGNMATLGSSAPPQELSQEFLKAHNIMSQKMQSSHSLQQGLPNATRDESEFKIKGTQGINSNLSDVWPNINKSASYDNLRDLQSIFNNQNQKCLNETVSSNTGSYSATTINDDTNRIESVKKDILAFENSSQVKLNTSQLKNDINNTTANSKENRTLSEGFTSQFKKKLRSLLVKQKGKVHEIYNKFNILSEKWSQALANSNFADKVTDPVSLNLLTYEEAEFRLNIYRSIIDRDCRLPFIRISKDTTVDKLRTEKPIFFTSIICIVSTLMKKDETSQELILNLNSFTLHLIKNEIFQHNRKSIELLESLLTLCLWYNFPEWSNNTQYHLFNYISCYLTKDLGPTSADRSFAMFAEGRDTAKYKKLSPLEEYNDGYKIQIINYICATNIALFLRQRSHKRWSPSLEAACDKIIKNRNSKDTSSFSDDEMWVIFVKLNHLLEKIQTHLHEPFESYEEEDDPEYTERHTNNLFFRFKRQLDHLFVQIPNDRHRVLSFYYSVEGFLHQFIAKRFLVLNKNVQQLPAQFIDSYIRCGQCCILALKEFLKLSPRLVASLPLFHMSRVIYTVGMLLLRCRYSSVSIRILNPYLRYTDGAVDLINQVSDLLEKTSKIYVYNTFILKFQYVVALFVQTYASRVLEEGQLLNIHQRSLFKDSKKKKNEFKATSTTANLTQNAQNSASNILKSNANVAFNNSPPSFNSTTPTDASESPATSSGNLTEYLTDIDSLVLGFNQLNDEFWSDIFSGYN